MNDYTKMALGFAAGLIIGIGIVWIVTSANQTSNEDVIPGESTAPDGLSTDTMSDTQEEGETNSVLTQTLSETSTTDASVTVDDQSAGSSVRIAATTLPADGWIVVHEEQSGFIGNALGAARRDAGTYSDIVVPLLRNTEASSRYWIVLYTDDGNREFSLSDDFPVRDAANNPVTSSFFAQ